MAPKKKQYRDKFGRFAKRGQPLKPPQPRVKGKYVPRPAPLRLGINKQGKRYWVKPKAKRSREVISGGEKSRPIQRPTMDVVDEVREEQKKPTTYGYDAEDFEKISNHPDGYSYVLYHIMFSPGYKQGGSVVTIRGGQYNTPEEVIQNWETEVDEIMDDEGDKGSDLTYIRTIVAVVPKSGGTITHGSVYPEDYHPKERPGTTAYEVEEGRRKLEAFGPPLPKGKRGSETSS